MYHSREAPGEGGATATLDNSLNKTDATCFVVLNYNMDYNRLIQSKDVFTKIKQYKIHSRNRSEHLNLRSKNTFNRTSTKISQTVEGTSREMCHLPPKPLF